MELLERYLYAISRHLPQARRDDIISELRENLLAQIEDGETNHGRPLTDDELSQLLHQHGRPILVAIRYLPQRSLIGPMFFPWYLSVLRWAIPLGLLAYIVASVSRILFSTAGTPHAGELIVGFFADIFNVTAWVTLCFAAAEFAFTHFKIQAPPEPAWDPRKLPRAEWSRTPESSFQVGVDIVVNALLILYFLAVPYHPFLLFGPYSWVLKAQSIHITPEWRSIYWLLVASCLAQVVVKLAVLVLPRLRSFSGLASNIISVIVMSILSTKTQFFLADPATGSQHLATVDALNRGLHIGLVAALVVSLIMLGIKLFALGTQTLGRRFPVAL